MAKVPFRLLSFGDDWKIKYFKYSLRMHITVRAITDLDYLRNMEK